MSSLTELLWRLLPDVRQHERSRFVFFGSLALLGSMAQTLGLVGSEALFLARFGAERLPETFIAASLLTVVGTFAYAARVGVSRNDELFVQMLVGAALVLGAAAAAAASGLAWVLPALFCFYYLVQAIFLNHFVTFAVDYFDASTSKRLFPLFSIGASVGGAVGGALGVLAVGVLGPASLVTGWAGLLALVAILLRLGRRRLRRWGPLDLEEADETSVENIQGAVRYLRMSVLGRCLVVSALGMVIGLFVAQYLYSDIFVRAFPDPVQLATFFGIYLGVTNVIEIGVGFGVTPWLIRRFGVASANLIHPVLILMSFGGLGLQYGLAAGVAARLNRDLVDNAMGFPVRSLVYNAMPVRLRGRVRAFLEGIVVYSGMSGAGLLLLALGRPDPAWLCAAGAGAGLVFLLANLAARRAYLHSLVSQMRAGRLDLADVGDEIGNWEASQLAELWEQMLREEGQRPSRSLLELVPNLARRGIVDPLIRETSHPSPEVRRSCLIALAGTPGDAVAAALLRGLDDADANVRLAALRSAMRHGADSTPLAVRIRELAHDPSPEVRAQATCRAGAEGAAVLREMLRSQDARCAIAALGVAPAGLLDLALARIRDGDRAVRAAALEAVARIAPEPPVSAEELIDAALDPDPHVRRAAIGLLANLEGDRALSAIAGALADPSSEVAVTAEALLGSLGEEGAEAALPLLDSECERAVDGALRVLARSGARERLYAQLRERVRNLWYQVVAYQLLPGDGGLASSFLRIACQDGIMRARRIAFRVLELLDDPAVIRKVEKCLRLPSTRPRGDALEVLSNLGDRESAQLLVLLLEAGSLREKIRSVERSIPLPESADEVIAASLRSDQRYIRMAARACALPEGETPPEEETMERLLALNQVPLFSQLSLEQLEAVLQITTEEEYVANEVIVREGDPGGVLYLLMQGKVNVYKNHGTPSETLLSTLSAVSYFGEMAILDDEPRSASVVAAEAARLLCLEGSSLKELVAQMPEISFEIFRVLTARVRSAEARLGER